MKNKCPHGSKLPKGLVCDRGYLAIRLFTPKGRYYRACGPHTKEMEKIGVIALNQIRESIYLGTFGIAPKTTRTRFKDARATFLRLQYIEYRDAETHERRGHKSIVSARAILNNLGEYFDGFWLDVITLKDIKAYRKQRLEIDEVVGSTVNREMAVMASIFNCFERWIAEEEITPITLPPKNPCSMLPDMVEESRERVASVPELRALKAACVELNDQSMWSIICTEMETGLRLNDLMRLPNCEIVNGQIILRQGKSKKDLRLPEMAMPHWSKVFVNFTNRWEKVRACAARSIPEIATLWFRDIRKTGLRRHQGRHSDEVIAKLAGNDVKVTQRWYLDDKTAEEVRPMIEETRQFLQEL